MKFFSFLGIYSIWWFDSYFFYSCFLEQDYPSDISIFFSTLGILTHGFLDACTSYGTSLFWPFSSTRVSWNVISIVDPFFF